MSAADGQKKAQELLHRLVSEPKATQRSVAKRLGVSQGMVSDVLSGRRSAGPEVLAGLARVYPELARQLLGVAGGAKTEPRLVPPVEAPVDDARARARRAYMELHPQTTRRRLSALDRIAGMVDEPAGPLTSTWWLHQLELAECILSVSVTELEAEDAPEPKAEAD